MLTEKMSISRRKIEAFDLLLLILPQQALVKLIWDLCPRARKAHVHVNTILGRGLKVESLEDVFYVAVIVNRQLFRTIEKPAAIQAIDRGKGTKSRIAKSHAAI